MNRMGDMPFRAKTDNTTSGVPPAAGPPAAELLSPPELALHVRMRQRDAWECGQSLSIGPILAEYPKIADDPESVVDLIYHEYLLRERIGRRPELDELSARFPEHAAALRKQIAFHLALGRTAAEHEQQPGTAPACDSAARAE